MRKLFIVCILSLCVFGCDYNSPEKCTPESAAKFLMTMAGLEQDTHNPHTVAMFIRKLGIKSKDTGMGSVYYGTLICKTTHNYRNAETCYIYIPQTNQYDLFRNPSAELGCNLDVNKLADKIRDVMDIAGY